MAVPKKKMSKSKTNSRKSNWKKKVKSNSLIAISLGKSMLKNKDNINFIYN
jgi:ribosomal protein L32